VEDEEDDGEGSPRQLAKRQREEDEDEEDDGHATDDEVEEDDNEDEEDSGNMMNNSVDELCVEVKVQDLGFSKSTYVAPEKSKKDASTAPLIFGKVLDLSEVLILTKGLSQEDERNKSVIKTGAQWKAYMSCPGKQRFLGSFHTIFAAYQSFDIAYRERTLELQSLVDAQTSNPNDTESHKTRSSSASSSSDTTATSSSSLAVGSSSGYVAINSAILRDVHDVANKHSSAGTATQLPTEGVAASKILAARKKSRSKNAVPNDVDSYLSLLDEDGLTGELRKLTCLQGLPPMLSSASAVVKTSPGSSSSSGAPEASRKLQPQQTCDSLGLAMLLGINDFSAIVTCHTCILGRAKGTTRVLLSSLGLADEDGTCGGPHLGGDYLIGTQLGNHGIHSSQSPLPQYCEVVHIGSDPSIALRHACIRWCHSEHHFKILALAQVGLYVDGKLILPEHGYTFLRSRAVLQLGQHVCYFLLPTNTLAYTSTASNEPVVPSPLEQRVHCVQALHNHINARDTDTDKVRIRSTIFQEAWSSDALVALGGDDVTAAPRKKPGPKANKPRIEGGAGSGRGKGKARGAKASNVVSIPMES